MSNPEWRREVLAMSTTELDQRCGECGREHPDLPYRCVSMCDLCGIVHPASRRHCKVCGVPSLFVRKSDLLCLTCSRKEARP